MAQNMPRRRFLQFTSAAAFVAAGASPVLGGRTARALENTGSSSPGPAGSPQPAFPTSDTLAPNILIIMNDEERNWHRFPSTAGGLDPWQYLTARKWLRQHGITFENWYTPTAPCSPSRSVFFTGHHAPNTGVVDNMDLPFQASMNTEIPTLADVMSRCGYYPALAGKWHLAKDEDVDDGGMAANYGFLDWTGRDTEGPRFGELKDPFIADDASVWLRGREEDGGVQASKANRIRKVEKQPWLLCVNFINPHDIMLVDCDGSGSAQETVGLYPQSSVPDGEQFTVWWDPEKPENADYLPVGKPRAHTEWAGTTNACFGEIRVDDNVTTTVVIDGENREVPLWKVYLNYYINLHIVNDNEIQKVLQALAESTQMNDTVIIFTADHGEIGLSHTAYTQDLSQAAYQAGVQGTPVWTVDGNPGSERVDVDPDTWQPVDPTSGAQPVKAALRQKGPFVYEENNNVPFVVASTNGGLVAASPGPDPATWTVARTLGSHVDIVPTCMAIAGHLSAEYTDWYSTHLSETGLPYLSTLKGHSLAGVLTDPATLGEAQAVRSGVLFTYDAPNSVDANMAANFLFLKKEMTTADDPSTPEVEGVDDNVSRPGIDYSKRGSLRGYFDGTWKFVRYFAVNAESYATQLDRSLEDQDVELYDLSNKTDVTNEIDNLALGKDQASLEAHNTTLRDLIHVEITGSGSTGTADDGRHTPYAAAADSGRPLYEKTVMYWADFHRPAAEMTASTPTKVSGGWKVTFDGSASSDPDDDIDKFFWDFGDGFTYTSKTRLDSAATHTYRRRGRYTATLTVTDATGLTSEAQATITVK